MRLLSVRLDRVSTWLPRLRTSVSDPGDRRIIVPLPPHFPRSPSCIPSVAEISLPSVRQQFVGKMQIPPRVHFSRAPASGSGPIAQSIGGVRRRASLCTIKRRSPINDVTAKLEEKEEGETGLICRLFSYAPGIPAERFFSSPLPRANHPSPSDPR